MKTSTRAVILCGFAMAGIVAIGARLTAVEPDATGWDAKAAATYLDARAEFWSTWPNASRDRGTFCISCHTTLPYALARPALNGPLGEREPSAAENKILNNLLTRARNWREVEPFYPDQTRGIPKTSESRAIEGVMNALVLSRRDARSGHLSDDARTALGVMWSLQMKTGPNNGGWTWLNFNYEPWESPNSPYFGASLAALAVGSAPGGYAATPEIQANVKALQGYFAREHGKVSLLNQLMGLWASGKMPDLLTRDQRQSTIDAALALQQPDGGWNTASLGTFTRGDGTANDTKTDGYGTALVTLALQEAGIARSDARVAKGLDWLRRNQDRATGRWLATSLNKNREPDSEPAKFMNDAATAYAVLALTYGESQAPTQAAPPPVAITQRLDTPQTRVYVATLQPHMPVVSKNGHATHRVLIYMDEGVMTIKDGADTARIAFKRGDVRWRPAGGPYTAENLSDHPIRILEIDLKGPPKGPAPVTKLDPVAVDPQHYKVDFENEFVRVLRVRFGPNEKGATHEHILNRVVFYMNDQPNAKADDVRISGAATHAEANESARTADRIAVEIK
jgi:squalene-hopene/tetraprenyl-beta-curcumene cyclase